MYRVLIADDEEIICRGLASMVSQRPELQVAALAEDGEIALEKARETRPDLMFVDINMPFLDGLGFVEKAREILPEAVIVIVTGYDDFEFVQKALQLGAADYVLKPVMEQPFFEVLDRAVRKLDSMSDSRQYISWMEEQMEQNRPRMTDDFLNSLLRGQMDEAGAKRHMEYLKIRIPVPYCLTVLHIYNDSEKDDSWYLKCCGVIQKCFAPCSEALCFQTEEGAVGVISQALPQQQWGELESRLEEMIRSELNARSELVRRQGDSIRQLPDVFRETMELYKTQIHYSDMVLQAISAVRMQWEDPELSLQSVADAQFVSASYLSRMFRRETGENFASYLTRKRINEAKLLLKNTNMRMYEIAEKTGYTSQHYFSNAFKKAMGISPADYRKNFQK